MYLSGICYYVSSTINPILYNVMSAKYRQAFSKTLCGITHQQQGPQVRIQVLFEKRRFPVSAETI